jgi:hypothetical protein
MGRLKVVEREVSLFLPDIQKIFYPVLFAIKNFIYQE